MSPYTPAKAGWQELEEGIVQVELRQVEELRETLRKPWNKKGQREIDVDHTK